MTRLGSKGSDWDVDEAISSAAQPGGPHTHPISDVTDLQTALDGKAASDHTHQGGAVLITEAEVDFGYSPSFFVTFSWKSWSPEARS